MEKMPSSGLEIMLKELNLDQVGRLYYTNNSKNWRIPISIIDDETTKLVKFDLSRLQKNVLLVLEQESQLAIVQN